MSYNQIPLFHEGDLYTYFNQLNESGNYGLGRVKKALYRHAYSYLYSNTFDKLTNKANELPDTITNALDFLKSASDSERNKEVRLIATYIERFYEQIPPKLREGKEAKDIINKLKKVSDTISNSSQNIDSNALKDILDNFYAELSVYINLTKQSIDELRSRITQIGDNTMESFKDLTERSYLYRSGSDVDTALKDAIGATSKRVANSFSGMLREIIFDYLESNKIISSIDIRSNFMQILAMLIVDFESFLQKVCSQNGNYKKLDDFTKTELKALFDNYTQSNESLLISQLNRVQNGQSFSDSFQQAIDDFGSKMGITYMSPTTIKAKKQLAAIDKYGTAGKNIKKQSGKRNYIEKGLRTLGLDDIIEENKLITITGDPDTRHGSMFEAIIALIRDAVTVGGTAATDLIELGTLIFQIEDETIQESVRIKLQEIAAAVRKTESSVREDRFDDQRKELIEANKEIKRLGEELRQLYINSIDNKQEDIFIYHDSLKLYATMEETEGSKRRAARFHGRDMQIFNALDNLYTLDDTGTVDLLDKKALYGAILNLSNLAVGHGQKSCIENYLSIFAGLLMFSDVRNIAIDMAQETKMQLTNNSDATHIHLYLLNDVYVPGSMILTYVYNAMTKLKGTIDVNKIAKATINVSGANSVISAYQSARANGVPYSIDDWDYVADAVAKATHMEITFMGTFLALIDNISNLL